MGYLVERKRARGECAGNLCDLGLGTTRRALRGTGNGTKSASHGIGKGTKIALRGGGHGTESAQSALRGTGHGTESARSIASWRRKITGGILSHPFRRRETHFTMVVGEETVSHD